MRTPVARPHLSARQRELVELAARGLSDDSAARELGLTVQTIRTYWKQIRMKFGGANRPRIIAEVLAGEHLADRQSAAPHHLLFPEPLNVEAAAPFAAHRDQLVAVLSALHIPIVVVWGAQGEIVFGNRAFEEMLRRPIAYSQSIRDYAAWLGFWESGRQLSMHEWPVTRVLRGEQFVEEEIFFLRSDGHWILVRLQAVPMLDNGQLSGALVAATQLGEFTEPPWSHDD